MTASQTSLSESLGITRYGLDMPSNTLSALKGAVENACSVPAARAVYEIYGRKTAAAKLTGERERVVDGDTEKCKVSVKRAVKTPQRRGRPFSLCFCNRASSTPPQSPIHSHHVRPPTLRDVTPDHPPTKFGEIALDC